MDIHEILFRVDQLSLVNGSFVVCGSAPLALAELRDVSDIDLFVSPNLFEELKNRGWRPQTKPESNQIGLVYDAFEAHRQWQFNDYSASLNEQLTTATVVDGIPFMSLLETRKWKQASGRPKDLADIALIDAYLAHYSRNSSDTL